MVPPLSSMSRWSGMKSMTGCSVNMSNSVELASLRADDVARELDDRALEAEAQPEVRDAVLAGVVGGEDLALDAAMPEPARDEDAGRAIERARATFSAVSASESTQRTLASTPWAQAACRSASVTDR